MRMMQATNLKTNHLTQPLGIDAGTLFLSWQCAEGVRQTAYEIEVTAGAETLWASGKALGSVMHTETPTPVPPKMQGQWRIRLWDENDQLNTEMPAYSKVSCFKLYQEEFEKTPKRSIKRYLYQPAEEN